MADWPDKPPHVLIAGYVEALSNASDDEILTRLAALEPLPDEDSAEWDDSGAWDRANQFVALADVAAFRRLRSAIPLLLERASFGDPGEMMRGLRHSLEAIVNPDWAALATLCIGHATSERLGARFWALDQLVVLQDPRARFAFEAACASAIPAIRDVGERGLRRLDQTEAGR